MPYIVVLSSPSIQLYVKDSIFAVSEEIPEIRDQLIRQELDQSKYLVGEGAGGGLLIIFLDKVSFIQYVSDEELEKIQEARQKQQEILGKGSNIQVPKFVIPKKDS